MKKNLFKIAAKTIIKYHKKVYMNILKNIMHKKNQLYMKMRPIK